MHTKDARSSCEPAETDQEIAYFQGTRNAAEPVEGFDDSALPGDVSFVVARRASAYGVSVLGAAAIHSYGISRPVEALSHLACTQQTLTRATTKQLRQELRRGWRAILNFRSKRRLRSPRRSNPRWPTCLTKSLVHSCAKFKCCEP